MTADSVQVWLIRTDLPADALPGLAAFLDPRERCRAGALTCPDDRRRYVVAHAATRIILGHHVGTPAHELAWRIGVHGKPELSGSGAGTQFSLSGSADVAMLAVSGSRRVGVDVQHVPTSPSAAIRIARRYFPPHEAGYVAAGGRKHATLRFTALWVRKEACVKATGGRLMQGMALPVLNAGTRVPGGALGEIFHVRGLRGQDGFRAALALEGGEPYRVTRHCWTAPVQAAVGAVTASGVEL